MSVNYSDILAENYADKEWSCGETYDSIVFHDGTVKPPDASLIALSGETERVRGVRSQIATLEASATPRRMREATLGNDGGWLAHLEEQIVSLRSQL